MYQIKILKAALKDKDKIAQVPALKKNVSNLLEILKSNPYQTPPPYEKLVGNLKELYSRRINQKHRLVYRVLEESKIVLVVSMWSHYEY